MNLWKLPQVCPSLDLQDHRMNPWAILKLEKRDQPHLLTVCPCLAVSAMTQSLVGLLNDGMVPSVLSNKEQNSLIPQMWLSDHPCGGKIPEEPQHPLCVAWEYDLGKL